MSTYNILRQRVPQSLKGDSTETQLGTQHDLNYLYAIPKARPLPDTYQGVIAALYEIDTPARDSQYHLQVLPLGIH